MIFEQADYRTFLKTVLAERSQTRSGYSLRGFAEKLGVSNSFLSEVLSSKKSLSVELAFKIAVKLDLTETETQYFCLLVQMDQEKDPVFREELARRLQGLNPRRPGHDLTVDVFKVISDWYHLAILELTQLTGFRTDAGSIAQKLGITKVEAELALERLVRLELIEGKPGKYRKTKSYLLAESKIPDGAFKQFHRQILDKATDALDTQNPQQRLSATDIVSLDSRHLPEVDRLSRDFSAAVLKLSEKSRIHDHVYALSTHMVRLTKHEGKTP